MTWTFAALAGSSIVGMIVVALLCVLISKILGPQRREQNHQMFRDSNWESQSQRNQFF